MSHLTQNILGVGTDIVSVKRIDALFNRYPIKFPQRILHADELSIFNQQREKGGKFIAFLARRFAAKEAVAKALGSGFSNALYARHINVSNDELGAPHVQLGDKIKECFAGMSVLISISDEKDYALAYAIAVKTS
ncbi:MAG: holo-ACP synthase [Candidatus Oxydemutatoraceae bacterium WSBS_2016_MAG_OTU14]